MTIQAFERKAELGGGFRGTLTRLPSKDKIESPVLTTYEEAMHWAQLEAHNQMAGRNYRRASVAGRGRQSYYANIWA